MAESYNPSTVGTPCCQFSAGVQEYSWSNGGYGNGTYKCPGCEGNIEKTRGWFLKSMATQARELTSR